MTSPVLFYFMSALFAFVITGGLAWFAWGPGGRIFALLAASECALALMDLLSMLAGSPSQAMFWFKMRFLFISVIPVLWLTFALDYSGHREWIAKRLLIGSLAPMILLQIVLWTHSLHGLWVQHDVEFVQNGRFWLAMTGTRVPGPGFIFYLFYSLLLITAGIGVIGVNAWQRRKVTAQAGLLVGWTLIVLVVALGAGLGWLPQFSISLLVPLLSLSSLTYAVAIFRFGFLKQNPTDTDIESLTNLVPAEKHFVGTLTLIFLVALSVILAIGYVTYRNFKEDFVAQVGQQISTTASLKADTLRNWRQERLADAGFFYQNEQFAKEVRLFLDAPQDPQRRTHLLTWMQRLEVVGEYNSIFLLDDQGAVLLSTSGDAQVASFDLGEQTAFSLASDQILFFDFHRHEGGASIFLSTMTPLFDDQVPGRLLGVLVMQIDPTFYLYPLLQQWPVVSQSAETLLVRRDEQSAIFLNPLRFQPEAALSLSAPISLTQQLAAKAALGQTGIVEGEDYRGVEVVGDIQPVPDSPWFLVSKMDKSEVYAPLWVRMWQTVIILGLLIVGTGATLFQFWRQQQDRTYRMRYEASVALRASEEKFRIAFETSPDAIAINRLIDGMYVSINQSFTRILGYNEVDLIGRSSLDLEIWDDPRDRDRLVQELRTSGMVDNLEARFRMKDGDIKIGFMSASVITLDGVAHILSITRDVTERRRAELALQRTVVARLNLIEFAQTHSIHELLVKTLDEVCAIVESPIGFFHFVDADQQTLSLQAWSTRTAQEYWQINGAGMHAGLDEAGLWADCVRQRRPLIHNSYASQANGQGWPDGQAELVRELVVPILRDELIVAILGVGNKVQDYTQEDVAQVAYFADVAWEIIVRKKAEASLRRSEEKWRSLFELLPVGVSVVDAGSGIKETNLALCQILDLPVDALFKGEYRKRKYYRPDGTPMLPDEFPSVRAVKEQAVIRNVEIGVEKENGDLIWTDVSATPLQDPSGAATVTVDITERKRAEEILNSYADHLANEVEARTQELHVVHEQLVRQERLATLGQLAGSIGHELRNPLGVISNAVYFLKMTQPQADGLVKEYLDIIENETRTSNKIVTDLLDFTRIKSVDRRSVAIPDLIQQILDRFPAPPSVHVALEIPSDLPHIFADPQHVLQILGNLTVNACQAMSDGGVLTIAAVTQADTMTISVQDTGAGISSENMGKLFEPLFTTKINGVGLGLAVSKKFAEANGGSIMVQSQPGLGSRFTLVLPLAK